MKDRYTAKYNIYLPERFIEKGEVAARETGLEILPNTVHVKFSEWFEKAK